jgi:hypothetical protein
MTRATGARGKQLGDTTMKIAATYACGHDATKNFDGRNMGARCDASAWESKAAGRCCPTCNKTRRVAAINAMDADTMRQILIGLVTHGEVIRAIEDAAGTVV